MVAKATMEDIVKQLELDLEADIVQSVTKKKTIILAEKVAGKQRISKKKKRGNFRVFQGSTKTWKERSIVLYFGLHNALSNLDFDLTSKAFNTPRTTILTWYAEKRYWGNFIPFLETLSVDEVVKSIPDASVRQIYEQTIDSLGEGSLHMGKFNGWKDEKKSFTSSKNNRSSGF